MTSWMPFWNDIVRSYLFHEMKTWTVMIFDLFTRDKTFNHPLIYKMLSLYTHLVCVSLFISAILGTTHQPSVLDGYISGAPYSPSSPLPRIPNAWMNPRPSSCGSSKRDRYNVVATSVSLYFLFFSVAGFRTYFYFVSGLSAV